MKEKKPKCCEFCHYRLPVVFSFSKQLPNLINYSFWMMTMNSFRLKTFFARSFQHSVSILTNFLAYFFLSTSAQDPYLTKPRKIYKQTKTTQQQIHSHQGTCFQVPDSFKQSCSNEKWKNLNEKICVKEVLNFTNSELSSQFWARVKPQVILIITQSRKNCAIIVPSRARAWFENKRFDWLSVNFFVHWPIRMLALLPFLHSITSFLHCVKEKLHCSQPIRIE